MAMEFFFALMLYSLLASESNRPTSHTNGHQAASVDHSLMPNPGAMPIPGTVPLATLRQHPPHVHGMSDVMLNALRQPDFNNPNGHPPQLQQRPDTVPRDVSMRGGTTFQQHSEGAPMQQGTFNANNLMADETLTHEAVNQVNRQLDEARPQYRAQYQMHNMMRNAQLARRAQIAAHFPQQAVLPAYANGGSNYAVGPGVHAHPPSLPRSPAGPSASGHLGPKSVSPLQDQQYSNIPPIFPQLQYATDSSLTSSAASSARNSPHMLPQPPRHNLFQFPIPPSPGRSDSISSDDINGLSDEALKGFAGYELSETRIQSNALSAMYYKHQMLKSGLFCCLFILFLVAGYYSIQKCIKKTVSLDGFDHVYSEI